MNTKHAENRLVTDTLMLPIANSTADSDHSSPRAFVNDSAITTRIKAELAKEKLSSLVRIYVDTDKKGKVILGGTVASQKVANKAVLIALTVKGVTSVTNHISSNL